MRNLILNFAEAVEVEARKCSSWSQANHRVFLDQLAKNLSALLMCKYCQGHFNGPQRDLYRLMDDSLDWDGLCVVSDSLSRIPGFHGVTAIVSDAMERHYLSSMNNQMPDLEFFVSTLGWLANDLVLRRELINQIEGRMEMEMEVV